LWDQCNEEKKGSLHEEIMAKLHFIDFGRKLNTSYIYLFIESEFTGLARSSPSILDNFKAPPEKVLFTTQGPL
jgi:hypothetical protein